MCCHSRVVVKGEICGIIRCRDLYRNMVDGVGAVLTRVLTVTLEVAGGSDTEYRDDEEVVILFVILFGCRDG